MSQAGSHLAAPLLPLRLPHLSPSMWAAALIVAFLAATVPGLWSLAGLGALVLVVPALLFPEVAVYLLALSIPLGSLAEVEVGKLTVSPTEILAGLLAVGWIARGLARGRLTVPLTPLLVPLIAVIGAVAFSAFHAQDLPLAMKETLKWLQLLLVYLFVVAEMDNRRQVTILLGFLFAGATIEALVGLGQFLLGIGPEAFAIGRFMRAYGTFEQPNPYAGYLGMLVPVLIAYLLARPGPRAKKAALFALALAAAAVGASLSRGAWVGIGLAAAAMMVFWSRRSRILLGAGTIAVTPVAALAFLNVLPPEVNARLATALDYFRFIDVRTEVVTSDNWAVLERVAHWQAAVDMFAANPLFGVGAGNYPAAYEMYMVEGWTEPLGHAHNYYLNMAAETGVIGLGLYMVLLVAAFLSVIRWLLRHPDPRGSREGVVGSRPAVMGPRAYTFWRAILLGVLGTLVATSVHNLFDNLFVHGMSVQLGMLLAMAQVAAGSLLASAPDSPDSEDRSAS